jgi:DUF3108-like
MYKGQHMLFLDLVLTAVMLSTSLSDAQAGPSSRRYVSDQTTPYATNPAADTLCSVALFPVQVGASWTYSNTSQNIGNSSFTNTITAVQPDGFTIASQSGNSSAIQNWACTTKGLLALSSGSRVSTPALSIAGVPPSDLTVSNATGVTLPSTIQPNMRWPYDLDVAGTFVLPGNQSISTNGTVSTLMQDQGADTITVPAGTFAAQKIQANSTMHVMADFHGIAIPLTASFDATLWLAPGVGWIRSVETGRFAGATYNSTTELQSYTLP